MTLHDACQQASELNRKQQESGTPIRYVVVAKPIGSCDGDHQVIARRVREAARSSAAY